MSLTSARSRRLWALAAGWLLIIYATLYPARPVAEYLRRQGWLGAAVGAALAGAGLVALVFVLRSRPSVAVLAVAAATTALYLAVLPLMERPEERLHFLEYGVFALLVERAWRASERRADGRWRAALGAVALTAACGWLDEGIQALLPNRYYDLRDVVLNTAAGLVAIAASLALSWAASRR